jgi:hypothetical protein
MLSNVKNNSLLSILNVFFTQKIILKHPIQKKKLKIVVLVVTFISKNVSFPLNFTLEAYK